MEGDRHSGPWDRRGHLGNQRGIVLWTRAFLEMKGRTGDWAEPGSSQWVGGCVSGKFPFVSLGCSLLTGRSGAGRRFAVTSRGGAQDKNCAKLSVWGWKRQRPLKLPARGRRRCPKREVLGVSVCIGLVIKTSWLLMWRSGLQPQWRGLESVGGLSLEARKVWGSGFFSPFAFLSVCFSGGVLSKPSKDHCLRLANPSISAAETIGNP